MPAIPSKCSFCKRVFKDGEERWYSDFGHAVCNVCFRIKKLTAKVLPKGRG